jgi:hypothetical protein
MTVVPIPIREIDGTKTLLAEHNSNLQICSHKDQTLVTLYFLNRTLTVESGRLQAALQTITDGRSKARAAAT